MTQKFDTALSLALEAHSGQIRKGTENALGLPLPYITHPVAVATLAQRYGGNEDQVIAALLHDVLEDGGPQWADPIRDAFGGQVLDLVRFCTDGLPDAQGQKSPWRERRSSTSPTCARRKVRAFSFLPATSWPTCRQSCSI